MTYLPTFSINLSQMHVTIPYMDPMGHDNGKPNHFGMSEAHLSRYQP